MQVLLADELQHCRLFILRNSQGCDHIGQQPQMGQIQHRGVADQPQAVRRQFQDLSHAGVVHIAHAFKAYLHDLLESLGSF